MKRWLQREAVSSELQTGLLAEQLGIPERIVELLACRGLSTLQEMNTFLSPLLRHLVPPTALPGLEEAVDVLVISIAEGRKVLVWGDYDVDGVTASAVCMQVLEHHGVSACVHLPNRQEEGYGLNIPQLERHAAEGCGVLLTVDCGISDTKAVARARELGMKVVVSDHHLPPAVLPDAEALCNPRLVPEGVCPCPHLAGVGVAFYLMAALNQRLSAERGEPPLDMRAVLDLVALGTLADMVDLGGQNRILAKNGLLKIAEARRPGLAELKAVSGYGRTIELGAGQVVFNLAPRINAAGRVGSARDAFQLLHGQDVEELQVLASKLDALNTQRRLEEEHIFTEAFAQAQALLEEKPWLTALVLCGHHWHQGVIGIVASRIVEALYRPTLVLCGDGGCLKGSGRSVHELDLHEALSRCADVLLGFGGHRQAAGLRLEPSQLEVLRERFHLVTEELVGSVPLTPRLLLDGELSLELASDFTFLKSLELLQPFGMGNPEPVFSSQPLVVRSQRVFGQKREHVTLRVQEPTSGISLQAKVWRQAKNMSPLENKCLRLAFTPCINVFNGVASVELNVKDWQEISG